MSRKILESCLQRVPNKFELVLLAAARTRRIVMRGSEGAEMGGSVRHSYAKQRARKAPYLALCEIAGGVVDSESLRGEYSDIYDRTATLKETVKKSVVRKSESEAE